MVKLFLRYSGFQERIISNILSYAEMQMLSSDNREPNQLLSVKVPRGEDKRNSGFNSGPGELLKRHQPPLSPGLGVGPSVLKKKH